MTEKSGIQSCTLRITTSSRKGVLDPSVLGSEPRAGLIWFEPAPGTRGGEHSKGFHPLLRDTEKKLPEIEMLEIRHFRPAGLSIWRAVEDLVRCSVIVEVAEEGQVPEALYYPEVLRLEKTCLTNRFDRFRDAQPTGTEGRLKLIEYWLDEKRIAWTLTQRED